MAFLLFLKEHFASFWENELRTFGHTSKPYGMEISGYMLLMKKKKEKVKRRKGNKKKKLETKKMKEKKKRNKREKGRKKEVYFSYFISFHFLYLLG